MDTTGLSFGGGLSKLERVREAAGRRSGTDGALTNSRPATARSARELADELDSMQWDDEIDVVCVGTGSAGVAAALAARTIGLTTCVVGSVPEGTEDTATAEYLSSVTSDVPVVPAMTTHIAGGELPLRLIDGPLAPAGGRRSGAVTFIGASLRTWAADCLASPCSVLSTSVADPRLTSSYRCSGQTIEAVPLGTVDLGQQSPVSFSQWLADWAAEQSVLVEEATSLRCLVFEAGQVVGAVIDTPSGSTALRTTFGVVLTLGDAGDRCVWPTNVPEGVATAEVAFVTRAASRFGRLELLVDNPRH